MNGPTRFDSLRVVVESSPAIDPSEPLRITRSTLRIAPVCSTEYPTMPSTLRVRARLAQSASEPGSPVCFTTFLTWAAGMTRIFFCLRARTIFA